MLSYTGIKNQCVNLTQDATTDAATFFQTNINIGLHILEAELGSYFIEESVTIATIAGTSVYSTPVNFIRLKKAYITIAGTRYLMDPVQDEDEWQVYKQSAVSSSDILQKIFVSRDSFEVYPTPASSSLSMTIIYEYGGRDLGFEDYTDGTITTLANGSKAVTGTNTTFTAAMVGRYLKITSDGNWYKIAAFGSATTLTLDKAYEGSSISAGTEVYTIGQIPRLPSDTHQILAYYAVWQYYTGFKQNSEKGVEFRKYYMDELERAKKTHSRRYSSAYIPGRMRISRFIINPNDYPMNMS